MISLVASTALLAPHVTRTAHADPVPTDTPSIFIGSAYHVNVTADSTNTSGYILYINDSHLNNQPNLNLQVTQVWPNNYDPHPIGVWYDGDQWTVFNEDIQPIPLGTSFHISIQGMQSGFYYYFIQLTASADNTNGAATYIDNRLVNGDPTARIFVTQVWTGTYNPHEVGVYYDDSYGRWEIFNEDLAPIPIGATFHLLLIPNTPVSLVGASYYVHDHQATSANTDGYITYLDWSPINGQPDANLRVAQFQDNTCYPCVYNPHTIGIWYDDSAGQWTIYNVDGTAIPIGAEFIVTGI